MDLSSLIGLLALAAFIILIFSTVLYFVGRYKRCPSDKILVIYGKVDTGKSSKCMHGGGTIVWPIIQNYSFMSLTPMTINIPLQGALSQQNIRINVPSTFTDRSTSRTWPRKSSSGSFV